jgi:hypothetical protein
MVREGEWGEGVLCTKWPHCNKDVFAVTYKHRHGSTIQKEYKRKEEDGAQLDVEPRGRME